MIAEAHTTGSSLQPSKASSSILPKTPMPVATPKIETATNSRSWVHFVAGG